MPPTTPPTTPAAPVPEPTQGGSYVRNADGSLTRVAHTAMPTAEERAAAKRKALGLDGADEPAPQPAPEQ